MLNGMMTNDCIYIMLASSYLSNNRYSYYVKVGMTTNLKQRWKAYQSHNPGSILVTIVYNQTNLSLYEFEYLVRFMLIDKYRKYAIKTCAEEWMEVEQWIYDELLNSIDIDIAKHNLINLQIQHDTVFCKVEGRMTGEECWNHIYKWLKYEEESTCGRVLIGEGEAREN